MRRIRWVPFVALPAALVVAFALVAVLGGGGQINPDQGCGDAGGTVQAAQQGPTGPAKPGIATAAKAALAAGWTGTDAVTAVAVAGAESTYNPTARNSIGASGLWQMRMPMHADIMHGDWRDPYVNAAAAHTLWQQNGWQPWTTFTSGAYRRFLPAAAVAVREATTGGVTLAAAHTGPGLQPAAIQAEAFVRAHWHFRGTIGGYANRNIAGTSTLSKHALGLAIDVMMPVNAESNAIADYFAGPGYRAFNVDNVIHNHRIYNAARGWHAYTGVNPHTDHVHIDFQQNGPATDAAVLTDPTVVCNTVDQAVGGSVVYPEPKSSDRHNYGGMGAHWAHGHTGTDFSVPCGRPVRAATAGTVVIENGPSWYGTWLVKVSTGPGKLTTWYAHMQALNVTDGQQVQPGSILGEVGDRGNAFGCHLHFEVHPHGGGIYQDGVNPSVWLAQHAGRALQTPDGFVPASANADGLGGFTISTFNVLGDSHTGGHGKEPNLASGPSRMVGAVGLLDAYTVDVVGFQEFQRPQAAAFARLTGGRYASWHPGADTENSIAWRTDAFDLVGHKSVSIPYFDGHPRRMPVVQLRDKRTGQVAFFANFHNPAETARYHHQQRWRDAAKRIEIHLANSLMRQYQVPVFITGDMNEHGPFYCPVATATGMHAAAGGSTAGGCHPPSQRRARIDWILGSPGVQFSGYRVVDGPHINSITDHPFTAVQAQTS